MQILDATGGTRKLPVNLRNEDLPLFEKALEWHAPEAQLQEIRNVCVNDRGLIFKNFRILPQSFVNGSLPPSYRRGHEYKNPQGWLRSVASNYLRQPRMRIERDCLWFVNNWSANYFHWMLDALPRLFSVRNLLSEMTILLPSSFEGISFVKPSLRVLGVGDVVFIPPKAVFRVHRLFLPTEIAVTGNYNEELVRNIRSRYRQFYSAQALAWDSDKIYISRSRAASRRTANEEEVTALLKDYGFRVLHFEDLTFDQQAATAMKTRYLVSNHGAGLTNMLFMESGNYVLELRREGDGHNNCYFTLASALALKYFYQSCKIEENGNPLAKPTDITVDLQVLKGNLELMLNCG